jgi:tRNA (cytidine56-2'-O)-methyltransferase
MVARAMGAEGIYLAGIRDDPLRATMEKIVETWGGSFWIESISNPLRLIREFKAKGGKVVHLTMYGVPLREVAGMISSLQDDLLIIVGGEKVPREYYLESDYNVSVGSQPHSEVAALALLLDRLTHGNWETREFSGAKAKIIPSEKGKNVLQFH